MRTGCDNRRWTGWLALGRLLDQLQHMSRARTPTRVCAFHIRAGILEQTTVDL